MNIDDLKNTWNEDTAENTPKINTEQRKKLNLPLEKIRANMRMEFWSTNLLLLFVLIAIWFLDNIPFRYKLYIEILVVAMSIVTYFFFSKFFKLYQEISKPALETLDALKDLQHQFNLNKQYYLSFYISFIPFLVGEMIIIMEALPYSKQFPDATFAIIFTGSIVLGLFFMFAIGKFWFNYLYGKHIKNIEKLIEELK